MTGLRELQQLLQRHIVDGDPQVLTQIAGGDDIYVRAYRARLLQVLAKDFPALRACVGAVDFATAARAYIEAYPSQHYSLRWYGERYAGFLRSTGPWRTQAYWADLASLDWAIGTVFDAADDRCATPADLTAVPQAQWPRLHLQLQAAWQRVPLRWNAGAIRRAYDDAAVLPAPRVLGQEEQWVVWRRDGQVHYRALGDDEILALDALGGGADFSELCVHLYEAAAISAPAEEPEPMHIAQRAAAMLRRWVDERWLVPPRLRAH